MLRSFVTVLLLLTLPLAQARAMVVCAMQHASVAAESSDCTCPHGKHADHASDRTDAVHKDCCAVEFVPMGSAGAALSSPIQERPRSALALDDSTLLAIASPEVDVVALAWRTAHPPPDIESLTVDGRDLFLRTGRLRL